MVLEFYKIYKTNDISWNLTVLQIFKYSAVVIERFLFQGNRVPDNARLFARNPIFIEIKLKRYLQPLV